MTQVLTLQANIKQPYWMLSQTIQDIGNSVMKLVQINEMQKLYENGAEDNDFIIGSSSLPLDVNMETLGRPLPITQEDDKFIELGRKSNDAKSFWELFHSLHRPIIFYKTSEGYKSLYNSNNFIEFTSIDINSPHKYKIKAKKALKELGLIVVGIMVEKAIDSGIEHSNEIYQRLSHKPSQGIEQHLPYIEPSIYPIIESNPSELNKLDLILENQESMRKQIQTLNQDNQTLLKKLDTLKREETNYLPFLNLEKEKIEYELKRKLEKRPLIVKDFEIV